ncbi:MAG: amidohydrolase [Acidobacteria bacterium]|nr:amidohydrolase [Acidobacteriota bacterium]
MKTELSRRSFMTGTLRTAAAAALAVSSTEQLSSAATGQNPQGASAAGTNRIVDIHLHYKPASGFIDDYLRATDHLNYTACMLTPFENRKEVAEAAKKHPTRIIPIGSVLLDAPDVTQQIEELHDLGYRGLGELEFPKKTYVDPSYTKVYELANRYKWVVLFHTGIVLRAKFTEAEDVASYRMSTQYIEEVARRFPQITVIGAHCGNPDYQWSAEIARWNPNVFYDLSGTTLTKLSKRLDEFSKFFWWSDTGEGTETPEKNPSAFSKIVFGTDTSPSDAEHVLSQYKAMFDANSVPDSARRLILGGTLSKIFGLQA